MINLDILLEVKNIDQEITKMKNILNHKLHMDTLIVMYHQKPEKIEEIMELEYILRRQNKMKWLDNKVDQDFSHKQSKINILEMILLELVQILKVID